MLQFLRGGLVEVGSNLERPYDMVAGYDGSDAVLGRLTGCWRYRESSGRFACERRPDLGLSCFVVTALCGVMSALDDDPLGVRHLQRCQRVIGVMNSLEFAHGDGLQLPTVRLLHRRNNVRMAREDVSIHLHAIADGSQGFEAAIGAGYQDIAMSLLE